MRRLLLMCVVLWLAAPAAGMSLRPDGAPPFDPPRERPDVSPAFAVPVGPGFETPPRGSPFDPPGPPPAPPGLDRTPPWPPLYGPFDRRSPAVPEPAPLLLLGLALLGLAAARSR